MTFDRLTQYVAEMKTAARDALGFIETMQWAEFAEDKRTQLAVTMCLIRIGEQASKLSLKYPSFAAENATIPWQNIRNMRNQIAHNYENVDLEVVWRTVKDSLPELVFALENAAV